MTVLTDLQAAEAANLTAAFKAQQNREAAKMAALVALYYQRRVQVDDPRSVEKWLTLVVPRLIAASDAGATKAAQFYADLRRLEVPNAPGYAPRATLGFIDEGVRKSLLTVGPYDYTNKARDIKRLDLDPTQEKAMLIEAKQVTAKKLAAATVRHAQAGGRQTIDDNVAQDRVALGWVRVTKADPCFFCAALASRGLHYRAFKEGSFDLSNQRFTGDGEAKVHDECGCSLKPVYTTNDPLAKKTQKFADQWSLWGAGGGDALARFRRGYEHWRKTGENLTWDQANTPG